MLRRALQVYPSCSLAILRRSTATGTTTAAASSGDPLKDLVELLSSENEISPIQRPVSPFTDISNVEELKNLANKNAHKFLWSDYLKILKASFTLFRDKKDAYGFIKKYGKESSDANIANMVVNDDLIAILTVLLELDLKEEKIFQSFEKKFLEMIGEADFSISSVVPFLIASHRASYVWPEEVISVLREVLTSQIRNVDSANILIAILSHWDLNDKKVSQAAAEKAIQLLGSDLSCCALTVGEMCSLMNKFAERGYRDKKLLPVLSARITDHQTTLSVRQLGSLAASCAKLSYFDVRVQRRLAKDLLVDVNNIDNWADVSSLVNSFSRLRFGEMMAWSALARWVNNHVDEAPLESLSIVVSGMARNGIEECRPAALVLSKRVRPELANSQNAWLSTVYSLAAYSGPSLELSDLTPFIRFDDETTRLARLIKYGKNEIELCNRFLSDVVFKMGSPSTHISPSCIDKVGVLVDARIVCEQGSTRLVAINKWGESVPRPIIFFGWGQTRQVCTDTVRSEENILLGWDQLALRLLRRNGIKPIV
ncbi:hypothetical protein Angca_000246, partial [Angiostrongylus cantonensis]